MRFAEIRDRIVNNPGFNSLEEVKKAGYRIVKERDGERYFLVKQDELKPLLVRLGDIAEVLTVSWSRQGQNTELMISKLRLESNEEIIEVIKSPKDVSTINVTRDDTKYFLKLPAWVREQLVFAPILWVDLRGDKHICHRCVEQIAFTHNFHGINPLDKSHIDQLCAIVNSTFCWLFIEILGRRGLGGGAIRVLVEDLKYLFVVPNLYIFASTNKSGSLKEVLSQMAKRGIKNIFEELGLPKPNRDYSNINPEDVSLDNILPDRRELDAVIFEILGLTEEEQLAVYRAVVELVKNRLVKARSI